MPEHMHELHKHAQEGAHEASLAPVTVTMAVLAVLVATVSLLGHRAHTYEVLLEAKASDQWAYYQAKDIRRHTYELFLDETSVFTVQDPSQVAKIKEKYAKEVERYNGQQKDIEADARKAEDDVVAQERRADRFDLGEVLLEAGLVICSITLLTHKKIFWFSGSLLAIAGVAIAVAGLFVH